MSETKADLFRRLLAANPTLCDAEIYDLAVQETPAGYLDERHRVFPHYYRRELAGSTASPGAQGPKAPKAPKVPKTPRVSRATLERELAHEALRNAGLDLKEFSSKITVNLRYGKDPPTPEVQNIRVYVQVPAEHRLDKVLDLWPSGYYKDDICRLWRDRREFTLAELRPVLLDLRWLRDRSAKDLRKQILDGHVSIKDHKHNARKHYARKNDLRRAFRTELSQNGGDLKALEAELNLALASKE